MSDRILVVDDEAGSREGLRRLLEAWGYRADTAASGEEALERVQAGGPSAIITDLVMPDGTGMEVLDAVRSRTNPEGSGTSPRHSSRPNSNIRYRSHQVFCQMARGTPRPG